jgi:predicted NBD/HSP70 family sugar kinase
MLRLLWPDTPLSRRDLQRTLDVHPNLIGDDIAELMAQGLVREGEVTATGRGRPGIPLRIDPDRRHVIGLAISPSGVQIGRVNLLGQSLGKTTAIAPADPKTLLRRAGKLLRDAVSPQTLRVGVSTTGLVDPVSRTFLLSSAMPQGGTSLAPLYDAAGDTPMIVQNDLHALAARWLLADRAAAREDVLLVLLEDGRMGAAMLIHGSPNQGCAIGANELGHMRFPIATPRCYCGQTGCLERIFSSKYLEETASRRTSRQDAAGDRRTASTDARTVSAGSGDATARRVRSASAGALRGGAMGDALAAALLGEVELSAAAGEILGHLAAGLANAANFVRPHRVVLAGSFAADDRFFERLTSAVRPLLLAGLSDRTTIERWNVPSIPWSEIAAWTALAQLFAMH